MSICLGWTSLLATTLHVLLLYQYGMCLCIYIYTYHTDIQYRHCLHAPKNIGATYSLATNTHSSSNLYIFN